MKNLLLLIAYTVVFSASSVWSQTEPARPSQLSPEILKRISDASVPALPQNGKRKATSDAQDMHLKGKVKSVIEEHEDLSGTWEAQGRNLWQIKEFDQRGDFLRTVQFTDQGEPLEVEVWGYIDGFRVQKTRNVPGTSIDTGGPPIGSRAVEPKKWDDRYSFRYDYTYADGRLTEERMTLSNGEPDNRWTYEWKGTELTENIYDELGKLNRGYVHVFDQKGNEIEEQEIHGSRFGSRHGETRQFKYETFDKNGNWTKQITLKPAIEDGKEFYKPSYITYRTITYYK
jgi:hypothetical protein